MITMNELRTKFDEDYFNGMPGEWLLKLNQNNLWQLTCTNTLDSKNRYTLTLLISECVDDVLRCHLYVDKKDRSGKILIRNQVLIPECGDSTQIVNSVVDISFRIQNSLTDLGYKSVWNKDINAFLTKLIVFRSTISQPVFCESILFNDEFPIVQEDIFLEDEQ